MSPPAGLWNGRRRPVTSDCTSEVLVVSAVAVVFKDMLYLLLLFLL